MSPFYAPSSAILLQAPASSGRTSTPPTIKHVSFDPEGVLLAVLYENTAIGIYDWDTIRAVRLENRGKTMGVAPFLPIPTKQRRYLAPLVWNSFNPDEIAPLCW